ncbi:hypothetical protein KW459_15725 [Vibrio fluvialis]|nr:hypothetical protein [Vibrio fluvialis]
MSTLEEDVLRTKKILDGLHQSSPSYVGKKAEFDAAVALLESENSRALAKKIQGYTEISKNHAIASEKSQKSSKRSQKISMLAAVVSALVAVYQVVDWQALMDKLNRFLVYFQ